MPRWTTGSAPARTRAAAADLRPAGLGRGAQLLLALVARLPSPFTTSDLRHGYIYELAFRQFEVSDTRVFDRPQAGRAFFEGLIRDHLDVGRPDQVALIFDRRVNSRTPARSGPRSSPEGVDPQLCCYYKSCRLKQYFKEHRALRTELVISDTRDFGIGRRVCRQLEGPPGRWRSRQPASLRRTSIDAQPAPDVVTFAQVTRPTTPRRPARPRHCASGTNASWRSCPPRSVPPPAGRIRQPLAHRARRRTARPPLHHPPGHLRPAPAQTQGAHRTAPRTHRYQLTPLGRASPSCSPRPTAGSSPPAYGTQPRTPRRTRPPLTLATAWRHLDHALDHYITAGLAAA